MKRSLLLGSIAALAASSALAADVPKINWDQVPANTITLFYPGQSSYQWVRSDKHAGAAMVKTGQACTTCHAGQEKKLGDKLVKAGPLEPTPVKGKNGWVDLNLKAAYDAKNLYLRYQWKTLNAHAGDEHQYLRYDGKDWKVYGYPKLHKAVQEGKQPGIYEDRMTIFIENNKVAGFDKQGCWQSCHDGQRDMPKVASRDDAQANPLLKAIKKNDLRKFLPATRTDPMDWKTGKSLDEIAKIKAEGGIVDTIQWRAHRSNPVGMADDGYVLEYRNSDAGKNPFAGNADSKTHQPKFMWDAKKVGYKSITADQLRKGSHFLIPEQNAVPFDPNAGWKEGDMIPDYLVTRKGAAGSGADNNATGVWKDGMWTVVVVRPLGLTTDDDVNLKVGGVYNVGFAVHDDNITTRGHFISFVKTLGIGAKADLQAVKLP